MERSTLLNGQNRGLQVNQGEPQSASIAIGWWILGHASCTGDWHLKRGCTGHPNEMEAVFANAKECDISLRDRKAAQQT